MTWGYELQWPCGGRALILDPGHDLQGHTHFCPVHTPEYAPPPCGVEYRDLHHAEPVRIGWYPQPVRPAHRCEIAWGSVKPCTAEAPHAFCQAIDSVAEHYRAEKAKPRPTTHTWKALVGWRWRAAVEHPTFTEAFTGWTLTHAGAERATQAAHRRLRTHPEAR